MDFSYPLNDYSFTASLRERNNHGEFILAEKVVFCDYMTWNAGIHLKVAYRSNHSIIFAVYTTRQG